MFDLYQAFVPAISIITFFNLLALKFALRDNVALSKIYQKKSFTDLPGKSNQDESSIKTLLKFMLLHFTPIEFCAVRRARYKIAFFCAISITTIATFFLTTPFDFAGIGSVVYLGYFLIAVATSRPGEQEEKDMEAAFRREKYLQIIFGIISIVVNILIIGLVFKNYKNSFLQSFIKDAFINIALDNFLIRPIIVTLIGLPLSRSTAVLGYVAQCQKQLTLLQIYEQRGQKQMLSKPGKFLSPSKIPRNIPMQFEVEPVPIIKENEVEVQKAMDMLRRIKKEKKLQSTLPQRNIQAELTLNSLFNSTKKQDNSQVEQPPQQQIYQMKAQTQEFQLPVKKKFCSQNFVMVNPSRQQQLDNDEEIAHEQEVKGKLNLESYVGAGHRETVETNNREQPHNHQDQNEPVKISLQSSSQPTSRQEPLRICVNGEINLDYQENYHDDEDIETDNYRKRRELHTIDQNFSKNTFGVLRIKQQNHHHHISQIEEIDLNSPERRKRQQIHIQNQEDSRLGIVKRKKKKFSHDNTQNRVIKFSTGEPYLQYLPHMLTKDNNKGKKSQVNSKRDIIVDSRATNSLKKPKKRLIGLQNNENLVPEFRIQEL